MTTKVRLPPKPAIRRRFFPAQNDWRLSIPIILYPMKKNFTCTSNFAACLKKSIRDVSFYAKTLLFRTRLR